MECPLEARGRVLGRALLWPNPEDDRQERAELLKYAGPTISMALDNALSFTAITDYRNNLELKVEERTEQLRLAQAARDQLFANINHDIRTPLSLIMLLIAKLKKNVRGEPEITHIASMEWSVRNLLDLVNGLLLLAAGDAGKLQLTLVPTDIVQVLRVLANAWEPAIEQAGLSLRFIKPEKCVARVDEEAFTRIVANLLSNAIKFTGAGGGIELRLDVHADEFEVAVRDTGIGIDADKIETIFDRFEQNRPAVRGETRGSGIGLSLVKELTEAHEGRVTVEAIRGGGTVFRIFIPCEPGVQLSRDDTGARIIPMELDPGMMQEQLRGHEVLPEYVPSGTSDATLLVAEDNPELLKFIASLLGQRYRVLTARDGISALKIAEKENPDMLVSDIGMPGMNGLELTKRFREIKSNRMAPVLLLTAFGNPDDKASGFDSGAVDYMTKPFEPNELMARVAAQLSVRGIALRLLESEKQASLGILASGLAHEIRNPANGVVNALDPLKALLPQELMQPGEAVYELMDVVETCAEQISKLSTQLLGFSTTGKLMAKDEDVPELVKEAVIIIDPELQDVSFTKEIDYQGEVYCSKPLLLCVITNLLKNAAQAAGPGGWVKLTAKSESHLLRIEVIDSGPGVPPDIREHIFQPFYTTKPPNQGSGLGLTTTRQIIHQHQGVLRLGSGGDTTFIIEIPLHKQSTVDTKPSQGTQESLGPAAVAG
ncbi:MAG: ATP-binding protein [Myxococcota bacterium]